MHATGGWGLQGKARYGYPSHDARIMKGPPLEICEPAPAFKWLKFKLRTKVTVCDIMIVRNRGIVRNPQKGGANAYGTPYGKDRRSR